MIIYSGVNDTFKDLGNKIEVRDGTVAGKVINGKVMFFEKWADSSGFKRMRESAFVKSKVDDASDGK